MVRKAVVVVAKITRGYQMKSEVISPFEGASTLNGALVLKGRIRGRDIVLNKTLALARISLACFHRMLFSY